MKFKGWKVIAETIGVTAIVASLLFVGLQIQQDQEIALVDTYSTITESAVGLADLVERNPEIWRRGLDGEELSAEERIKFLAIARAVEIHFSNAWIRWSRIGPNSPERAPRSYAYVLYLYPGLRKAMEDAGSGWQERETELLGALGTSALFIRETRVYLEEFDEAAPAVPVEKPYVFW